MAWLEKRGNSYSLDLRIGGRRVKRSLGTSDRREAEELAARVERRLRLIEQGDLPVPPGVDLPTFLFSDGQRSEPLRLPDRPRLGELCDRYLAAIPLGAMEENSLATVRTHLRHFADILGRRADVAGLGVADLQKYVDARSRQPGRRGRGVSPATIRKELVTLGSIWNWALASGFVQSPLPRQGLRFPKTSEKPPFQTRAEIERQIDRGRLTPEEQADLWDGLYLVPDEVEEVLDLIRRDPARPGFLFPMVATAAHTGARRGELLRSLVQDVDFVAETLLLRERKRVPGQRSTRSVPLSPRLQGTLSEWLGAHSARTTFHVDEAPVTVDQANVHFRLALAGTRWNVIRGWHVFRHSFVSICASRGVDQRLIDDWVGHQTEAMRRRYRHLLPGVQRAAIRSVFG